MKQTEVVVGVKEISGEYLDNRLSFIDLDKENLINRITSLKEISHLLKDDVKEEMIFLLGKLELIASLQDRVLFVNINLNIEKQLTQLVSTLETVKSLFIVKENEFVDEESVYNINDSTKSFIKMISDSVSIVVEHFTNK